MHYITFDTNTWIYLGNGTEPVKLLNYLKHEVENENIKILLPEQVLKEWEVNKEKNVKQGSLKHFNEIKDALDRLQKLLGDRAEKAILSFLLDESDKKDEKDYFKDLIDKFKQKKKEIEEAVTENINLIDDLFKSHAIIIKADNAIYKKAGDYALAKKAPFKAKNSFADALIVFSLLDYLIKNDIENAIFVSYNTDDFCEKREGKKYLHPDLEKEFQEAKCKFFKIVGEALNTIKQDLVSEEELALIEEIQDDENWSYSPEFCEVCSESLERVSEVQFGYEIELIDERLKHISNPDQLTLDFGENSSEPTTDNLKKTIEVGYCDWCNTEHFICTDCGAVNAVLTHEYDALKECQGCGLNYIVRTTYDRKGILEDEIYIIPKEKEICLKCGEEFDENELIDYICIRCLEKE
ncbi:MAG: DUF4935 domain-containing protein [Saprospiraceae bacterium]|nr:DUF4935 domain-containing protein [Saprospiraceae bacterium]